MSHDHFMPLAGMYFYQTGKTTWIPANAADLTQKLQGPCPPEFRTVLGIVGNYDETNPTHYSGPFYIDFDAADIDEAAENFKVFLENLRGLGVDLNACRFFASGGKGFHVEVPQAVFMSAIPDGGVIDLPYVFREVAHTLYVTTLDLRVYTARKGRMWRTPNRVRENGCYKVPLTVEEALNITAASYARLVAHPRNFPPLASAKYCPALAHIYSKAQDKVMKAQVTKRNSSRTMKLLEERCRAVGAALPPSLLALGSGRIKPRAGIGFNQIAIQLCTAAHALGTNEDELVALCAGLIANHEGDSNRYGTPSRRNAALRAMFRYTSENPCYEFSVGGVRSVMPSSASLNDLRGL